MAARPFESRIQDLVYNVDVGIGLLLIKYGLYILFVFLASALYTSTQFKGFDNAEAMDYAQLGRSIMEQNAYVTRNVRPASMWYLIQNEKSNPVNIVDQHPDLVHAPLYPVLLSVWFRITGQDFATQFKGNVFPAEYAIVTLNLLLLTLTGLLLYLLGLRMFERRVALLGVSLYFLSDLILGNAVSGLPITLLTFFTVLTFFLAWVATKNWNEENSTISWLLPFVFTCLLCILAFYTRYAAFALLPAVLFWYIVSMREKPWVFLVGFLVVFLLGITPWLVRNVQVSGGILGLAPYTALIDSSVYPDDMFERTLSISLDGKELTASLRQKWMENMSLFYNQNLPTMGGAVLASLFMVSFFYRFVRDNVHWLRWTLAFLAVLLTVIAGFFGDGTFRIVHVIWPFAILYATSFFFLLLDRLQLKAKVLNVSVIVLYGFMASLPVIFALLPPRSGAPYPPYFPPFISYVTSMLKPTELICTDMPWATAWYGGRTSLQLPVSIDEFYEINDYTKRVSGMYFTTVTRDKPYVRTLVTGSERDWFQIVQGRIPGDFPLTQGIPLNGLDQVFLTDRARWKE